MYQHELQLERIALHEAAHVVMFFNLDRKFDFVTINPTPNYAGHVYWTGPPREADPFNSALIACAGMVAERMKYGNHLEAAPENEHDDTKTMIKMVGLAFGTKPFDLACSEAVKTTQYILKCRWWQVENIAKALLEKGGLTYDECKEVMKKY